MILFSFQIYACFLLIPLIFTSLEETLELYQLID